MIQSSPVITPVATIASGGATLKKKALGILAALAVAVVLGLPLNVGGTLDLAILGGGGGYGATDF